MSRDGTRPVLPRPAGVSLVYTSSSSSHPHASYPLLADTVADNLFDFINPSLVFLPPLSPRMADESPPPKKAKVSSPPTQRTTRSSAIRQAPAPTPIVPPVDPSFPDDEDEEDDEPFEYESDEDTTMVYGENLGGEEEAPSVVVLDSEDELVAPPEPSFTPKPKLSSRKLFLRDIAELVESYGSDAGLQVRSASLFSSISGHRQRWSYVELALTVSTTAEFERWGDEEMRFRVVHPAYKDGLKLVLGLPEISGYPTTHQMYCITEAETIGPDVQAVLEEIAT